MDTFNNKPLRRVFINTKVSRHQVNSGGIRRTTISNQPHVIPSQASISNVETPKKSIHISAVVKKPKYQQSSVKSTIPDNSTIKIKKPPVVTHIQPDLTYDQVSAIKNLNGNGKGKAMVILGNGPSLSLVDTSKLVGHNNIKLCSINVPDSRCWPTPYWAFFDLSQYNRHKKVYDEYNGVVFNSTGIKATTGKSIKFKNISGVGYSHDISNGLYIGMSSVYAVIQISMYMGFDAIYVVGCDMNPDVDSGMTHFYGVNPDVRPEERKRRFKKEANWYDRLVTDLNEDLRNKIVFCSKGVNNWPFMEHFTSITAQEAVDFILNKHAW